MDSMDSSYYPSPSTSPSPSSTPTCLPTTQLFGLQNHSQDTFDDDDDDYSEESSSRPDESVAGRRSTRGITGVSGGGTASGRPTKKARTTRDFVPPDVSGLSKREARLVKNRAAAFLSRQRKREEFEAMEIRVGELEAENARLRTNAACMKQSSPPVVNPPTPPTTASNEGTPEPQDQISATARTALIAFLCATPSLIHSSKSDKPRQNHADDLEVEFDAVPSASGAGWRVRIYEPSPTMSSLPSPSSSSSSSSHSHSGDDEIAPLYDTEHDPFLSMGMGMGMDPLDSFGFSHPSSASPSSSVAYTQANIGEKRRVRISLKNSESSNGAEGGEWEVTLC